MHALTIRNRRVWGFTGFLLFFALSTVPAASSSDGRGDDHAGSPSDLASGGLLFRMATGYVIATKLNTDITIEANGLIARTTVRQRFRNDGSQWVEGIYVFPLPESSAVDRMRLYIGDRFIEGEVREKEQAKKEYDRAKKAGKKAGLVNQQRANLFTTNVANVAPGETIVVEIEYQQTLRYEEQTFSLRFPLTLTPRYVPGVPGADRKGSGWSPDTDQVVDASLITPPQVVKSDDHKVTLDAIINAGMPLEFVASRYHPVNVESSGNLYTVTLSDSDVPMDHDLELMWRPVPSEAPQALAFTEEHNGRPHVLVMLVPPGDGNAPGISRPREMIFVIDTSGSMHGVSIEQARKSLLLALDGLRPSDRFNVIQFNSVTHSLFNGTVDASPHRLQQARRYVQRLQANGGTEMRPALELALRSGVDDSYLRQIVFITDGSVGNEEALFRLIETELGASRLFTVGIGSAPNGWFMHKAAEAGRGTYTFISALHEVDEKMQRLFRKLEQPQVTNIAVQWPQGMTPESYPKIVPDLYSGEPVVIRARLDREIERRDRLRISGTSAHGEWTADIKLRSKHDSAGVAVLWARARIGELENRRRRGADAGEIRTAIIETAIDHHLVSKYTSLIAVDKTPVRPASESLAKEQVPNLLPHGQSMQAITGIAATATPGPIYRSLGGLFLVLAFLVWLWSRRHVALISW